ncbi:hypothetical protein ONE63_005044 [Megalurothrips usitatus]|uniref:beta-glucosidase n=1 Tax=Megalurothrips usitatus TaxID=439358 RepID=A0AAV7X2F0_9NEOP|nr:hypothetical protein ONE63_005044 [Megalurothrips usitatus]
MRMLVASVAALLFAVGAAGGGVLEGGVHRLPRGFLFGAGTSSYQTEGAWDQDGKGVNVFDYAFHRDGNNVNGDIASDSYNRYREDIKLAAELNLEVFRFSISLARIFPDGNTTHVNKLGVKYYHNVIDELLRYNIKPLITISHYDHPQALEDAFGGWQSERMVDVFVSYADFLFQEYGHKVTLWTTLNEINLHCSLVYNGMLAPGGNGDPASVYRCIHHEILAHARVYRLYEAKYKAAQKGSVGIGAVTMLARPNSTAHEDVDAARRANMFDGISILLHPIVYGDYPQTVRRTLEAKGRGCELPTFTAAQKKLVVGAVDFLGLNAYNGKIVAAGTQSSSGGSNEGLGALAGPLSDADVTEVSIGDQRPLLQVTPWLLRDAPLYIKEHYGSGLKIFITENGRSSRGAHLDDWNTRAAYHSAYLRELTTAINRDGANVIGYTAWAFLDSFEFDGAYGYVPSERASTH